MVRYLAIKCIFKIFKDLKIVNLGLQFSSRLLNPPRCDVIDIMIFFLQGFALCYCWFRKNVEPQYGSDLYLLKIYMISDDPGSHLYLYLGVNVFVKTDFYIRQCKNKIAKTLQILLFSTYKSTFLFSLTTLKYISLKTFHHICHIRCSY